MGKYEQPSYVVVSTRDDYEIRFYDSYLVAETIVSGSFEGSGNSAFRRLAGFIFGRNSESTKMKMTVPVTHIQESQERHRYRFVMESAYTDESLPKPLDDDVTVVRVPAGHYAATRYRGSRGERRFRRAERALLASIAQDGIEPIGVAARAVYDGPYVPAPMRRNEVLVPVAWSKAPAT